MALNKNIIITCESHLKKREKDEWNSVCRSTELFSLAQEEFSKNNFHNAESLIAQYKSCVNYESWNRIDNRSLEEIPKVSVIIVAYNTRTDLISLIETLQKQSCDNYEIIVVDNGGNESVWSRLHTFELLHIQCPMNFVLSEGRNIGVHFSRGQYISFLDDDALVPEDYVGSILEAFNTFPKIVGFRGKVLEKTSHKNNIFGGHYDLGNKPIVYHCNTEGNSAFRKREYIAAGGMNSLLFGEEGTELTARLSKTHGIKSVIYWPKTIIFHDYAINDNKKEIKKARHERMRQYINENLKHVAKYRNQIRLYRIPSKIIKKIKIGKFRIQE